MTKYLSLSEIVPVSAYCLSKIISNLLTPKSAPVWPRNYMVSLYIKEVTSILEI